MKKVAIDYKYLNNEIVKAIAKAYPNGFVDSDVITFSEVDKEMEDRIKVELEGVLFLIKRSELEDKMSDKFDDDYFSSLREYDESCDAESCE